jgi:hypothetical protein
MLATTALADNGILLNEFVRAGVNETTGTFGSGGNTRPGLQFDSAGTGTFPADGVQGDYLTPGTPFDGFSVKVDGQNVENNNAGNVRNIVGGWTAGTPPTASGADWTGTWAVGSSTWTLQNIYSLPSGNQFIDIETKVTAGSAATDVWFGRYIDPDAMPAPGDTSSTDNALGYGAIPSNHVVFSEATVSRYALGLYSTDSNVDAGISSGWTSEADGYTGSPYGGLNYGSGDDTIGLSWHWSGVGVGDIMTAKYAYIFGPSAFEAAGSAVEGGAGGGEDILTGELDDVGSATDAASGPTVVGTGTSSIVHHESTVADGIQTISREQATATWDVYSDDTLGDPVTTTSMLDSFVGRMDQGERIAASVDEHSLGLIRGVQVAHIRSNMGAGEVATTDALRVGFALPMDAGGDVFVGANRLTTNSTSGSMLTRHLGAGINWDFDKFTVTGSANGSIKDIAYQRSIGDFANAGSFSTKDRWIDIQVTSNGGKIRPFAGVVVGKRTSAAWSETGDVQSAIVHDAVDETYSYGLFGVNALIGDFGAVSLSHTTNGTTRLQVGIDYNMEENVSVVAQFNRTINDAATSSWINVGLAIEF